ncbi:MAG: sigma-E processing peptidase SpoIIGA [Clostridiaceae bacterium]|nr:sigma-E processing peptidase SpoIIGA [Clostridiaceae bacterium]
MVVYADLLFIENALANCLILKLASIISGCSVKIHRVLLAAALGAIYAVIATVFPEITVLSSIMIKIVVSVLMVLIAFKIRNFSEFLKRWGMMLLTAFLLAGCTYGLSNIFEGGVITYGGLMYVSPQGTLKAFMFSVGLCIVLIRPIGRILSGKVLREGSIIPVLVRLGEKTVRFNALIDTGNSLVDPITGYPVMVVEAETVKEILPPEVYDSVVTNKIGTFSGSMNKKYEPWLKRLHLIPFKSIGSENGLLTGFRPDNVRVCQEGTFKEINDVIVGICSTKLSHNSKYSALLGPAMIPKI